MCSTTFLTQATSSDVNAAQLADKNWVNGGADCDYDSYITSCLCLYEYDRHVTTHNNEPDRKGRERVYQSTYENGGVELRVLTRKESRKNSIGDTGANNAKINTGKGVVVFISAVERVRCDTEEVFEQAGQEKPPHGPEQRSYVEFILKPRYKLFAQVGNRPKKNEIKSNIRFLLRTMCSKFAEVFNRFNSMSEKHIPSPVENARQKGGQIYSGTSETERYEGLVEYDQDGRRGTNIVAKQLTQNCYKLPRKDQVEACKTDVHRYCRKVSNIFPLLVKSQNHHFEPRNYEPDMKTEKYSHIKDCKEQTKEICDWWEKKSIQPLCDTKERLVCTYKSVETCNNVAVFRRLVDTRIYSIMWRPGRSQLAAPLTKQEACRDKLRQAPESGNGDLESQSSSSAKGWDHCKNKFYEGEPLCDTQGRLVRKRVDSAVLFCETAAEKSGLKCFEDKSSKKNKRAMMAEPREKGLGEDTKNGMVPGAMRVIGPDLTGPNIPVAIDSCMQMFTVGSKEDTDSVYIGHHKKQMHDWKLTQNCHNLPRKNQAKTCKTDMDRYGEKSSSAFPFSVREQNYQFELKRTCKFEMKTRPKKAKKYSYIKDYVLQDLRERYSKIEIRVTDLGETV